MMNSAKDEHVILTRPIEIYENERLWIGRGWSAQGLLPTERGQYSTKDGSLSWKTMAEASLALLRGNFSVGNNGSGNGKKNGKVQAVAPISIQTLRRGWSYHEEDFTETNNLEGSDKEILRKIDEYECSTSEDSSHTSLGDKYCGFVPCNEHKDGPCDEEGWQYYPDFAPQSLVSPNRKRGMLDFVRRRKLSRVAIFRPYHFLPSEVYTKCDYCDSKEVDMLSKSMMDALSLASIFASGTKDITDAQALPLKTKLIDTLSIGSNCTNELKTEDYDPWIDINRVKDRLRSFADDCVGKPGPLTKILDPQVDEHYISAMPKRRKVVMERFMSEQECMTLTRLLIKDVDRYTYKMHCMNDSCACVKAALNRSLDHDEDSYPPSENNQDESTFCEFRIVECPNAGCSAKFSFKHRTEYDKKCEFKVVPCPSECGMEMPRNEVHEHVRDKCILRQAECPLSVVGCTATVQAKEITTHLNNHADKHFILMANRMMEYQSVIRDMNARVRLLEEKNEKLERELMRCSNTLQSKHDAQAISHDMKKLTKRIGNLESTCKTEFKKVEYDRKNHKK